MHMAAESLEVRMAHLEGADEQIDKRLGALETALRDLRGRFGGEVGSVIVVALLVPIALRFLPP